MVVNSVDNIRRVLDGFPVTSVHCCLDSSVALHWIRGNGEYRQFVANRVKTIKEHEIDEWRHVPTDQNPADLGSRRGSVTDADLWWNGPEWLQGRNTWSPNPVTKASEVTEAESKIVREVLAAVTVEQKPDEFEQLLERHDLRKVLRVCALVVRFVRNYCITGPITTAEIEAQTTCWIRRVQTRAQNTPIVGSDKLQLRPNGEKMLECRGRIQGRYPIYLPDDSVFAEKLVRHAHQPPSWGTRLNYGRS